MRFEDLILIEQENFVVVNKPPFLSTLDDRNDPSDLISLAREYDPVLSPGHRLDKETSGVLVLTRGEEAYRHFAGLLEKREVKKVYHAVIEGVHDIENVSIEAPIYSGSTRSRIDGERGKPSLTLVQTMEKFKKHTLLKCFPVTGRRHQIRVHLAYAQQPIIGDTLYGGVHAYLSEIKRHFNLKKSEEELPMIRRVALHAREISFYLPDSKNVLTVEAPYPKDFGVLIKQLQKFS